MGEVELCYKGYLRDTCMFIPGHLRGKRYMTVDHSNIWKEPSLARNLDCSAVTAQRRPAILDQTGAVRCLAHHVQ